MVKERDETGQRQRTNGGPLDLLRILGPQVVTGQLIHKERHSTLGRLEAPRRDDGPGDAGG